MASPADGLPAQLKTKAENKVGDPAVDGGKQKGGVDCFALVDQLLKSLSAKTAADFGEVTVDADYVWGTAVALDSVQPGDILQFRDHTVVTRTEALGPTRWAMTEEQTQHRPHHTAVVIEVISGGGVVVVEQNVKPDKKKIRRNVIDGLAEGEETRYISNKLKKIIKVTGKAWAYRPVGKSKGAELMLPGTSPGGVQQRMGHFTPDGGGPARQPGPIGMA
jgi:hypothetical protein